jgi:hypothetical protein
VGQTSSWHTAAEPTTSDRPTSSHEDHEVRSEY